MNAAPGIFIEDPALALASDDAWVAACAPISAEIKAFIPDLSTAASRAKIAGLAYKITKTKTAIDAAGKVLNEDARKQIGVIDARRRKIKEELEALADQARKPLDDWEAAEKLRTDEADRILADISRLVAVAGDDGSNVVADRIATIEAFAIDEATFRDYLPEALAIRGRAIAMLEVALARAKQHEVDRAELAELRAQQAARAAEDAIKLKAEQEKAAAEKRAADAKERETNAAAARQKAQEDAIEAARAEERRKGEAALAEAQRAETERLAGIARTEAADRARAADREHRASVMGDAQNAIHALGTSQRLAEKVVLAIVAGEIPNVTLRF